MKNIYWITVLLFSSCGTPDYQFSSVTISELTGEVNPYCDIHYCLNQTLSSTCYLEASFITLDDDTITGGQLVGISSYDSCYNFRTNTSLDVMGKGSTKEDYEQVVKVYKSNLKETILNLRKHGYKGEILCSYRN